MRSEFTWRQSLATLTSLNLVLEVVHSVEPLDPARLEDELLRLVELPNRSFALRSTTSISPPLNKNPMTSSNETRNHNLVRQPAPDFSGTAVSGKDFKQVSLGDFKGRYLVLFFYPLDFTFVCPTEILAFANRQAEFKKLDAEVVGVSVDSQYTHLAWLNTPQKSGGIEGADLTLVADTNHKIARDYGVLLEDAGVALRGLFIIDPEGIVRHQVVNDLPIGRSVGEALRVVQALRFHAEHGEVCPADWVPGEKSMKADPTGSLEYFGSK